MTFTATARVKYRKLAEFKGICGSSRLAAPLILNKGQPSGTTGNHSRKPRKQPSISEPLPVVPAGLTLWRSDKIGRAKILRARRAAARSEGPPQPCASVACVPQSWVHTFCEAGCFHTMVPSDSCGSVECSTCAPKLLRRRVKSAGRRFQGAPLLKVELTYPEEVVGRIDTATLAALSPIASTVVDVWLRHVHHLPQDRRDLLGVEDWPHPTGSGHCRKCGLVAKQGEQTCECGGRIRRRRPWHPHHNVLVRGQALWLTDRAELVRRDLFPHVQKADLDLLRSLWADALRAVFDSDVPVVDVRYGYVRPGDEARRSHMLKYVIRTWPGWHRAALGRIQRRAYGYFRRGWPLFRELLGLHSESGLCACGACISAEIVPADDRVRLMEIRCLCNGTRAPPR